MVLCPAVKEDSLSEGSSRNGLLCNKAAEAKNVFAFKDRRSWLDEDNIKGYFCPIAKSVE